MGFGGVYYHKNSRNKKQNFSSKNDKDVGMPQKQDIIQNGIKFIIPIPTFHTVL